MKQKIGHLDIYPNGGEIEYLFQNDSNLINYIPLKVHHSLVVTTMMSVFLFISTLEFY